MIKMGNLVGRTKLRELKKFVVGLGDFGFEIDIENIIGVIFSNVYFKFELILLFNLIFLIII